MGQFSNPVATHPRTNEVGVPPPAGGGGGGQQLPWTHVDTAIAHYALFESS